MILTAGADHHNDQLALVREQQARMEELLRQHCRGTTSVCRKHSVAVSRCIGDNFTNKALLTGTRDFTSEDARSKTILI